MNTPAFYKFKLLKVRDIIKYNAMPRIHKMTIIATSMKYKNGVWKKKEKIY